MTLKRCCTLVNRVVGGASSSCFDPTEVGPVDAVEVDTDLDGIDAMVVKLEVERRKAVCVAAAAIMCLPPGLLAG